MTPHGQAYLSAKTRPDRGAGVGAAALGIPASFTFYIPAASLENP